MNSFYSNTFVTFQLQFLQHTITRRKIKLQLTDNKHVTTLSTNVKKADIPVAQKDENFEIVMQNRRVVLWITTKGEI